MANTFTISTLDGTVLAIWGPSARSLPQAIEGRLDALDPVRYQFTGSAARGQFSDVRSVMVSASDLSGPAQAFDGTRIAQTFGPGRLVRISHWDNGDLLTAAGILVLVRTAVGAGGPGAQQVECVFWPMPSGSLLYGPAGVVIDTVPDGTEGSGS